MSTKITFLRTLHFKRFLLHLRYPHKLKNNYLVPHTLTDLKILRHRKTNDEVNECIESNSLVIDLYYTL